MLFGSARVWIKDNEGLCAYILMCVDWSLDSFNIIMYYQELLDFRRNEGDPQDVSTAVFYSISATQKGTYYINVLIIQCS